MNLTIAEAKTKECPLRRSEFCSADSCMAWKWNATEERVTTDNAGLTKYDSNWRIISDSTYTQLIILAREIPIESRIGHCGMTEVNTNDY